MIIEITFFDCYSYYSLVIGQKGESQHGGNKKAKHTKFSEKQTFFTPWYVNICVRIRG